MLQRLALRAVAASVVVLAFLPGLPAAKAHADPVLVYPGMEILQENRMCTLGYVDAAQKIAYTAGHCRSGANTVVTDNNRNVIGHLATWRDDTPSGTTVTTDQVVTDYEAIVLDGNVPANNILPSGRPLVSSGAVPHPGEGVCHFGVITGETCGTVESVNNGWFTMSHGVQSHPGDSGGPVYTTAGGQIVGIFNSVWGDLPAAVSWQTTSQQVRQDLGAAAGWRPPAHR
ncbi:hypothetical protein [Mycobacterium shigaense]|uniref:Uncharacterized protein n=1 Tax=Mycobacterium shigaense TaxID=722731 RepID=A0A1Z4EIC9_9MYCO|nr:hypothetical protein [Mycobacterium shigaense]MEA1123472.1 hypothetical protein [Mycobacterium shigaense]PRI13621.1 hypothetical protein B2J96_18255 [Mycobacterium shigaense]BAX92724.1 hypothetical protein MSG_02580 [Mycobacterium shigaense]